MNPVLEPGPFPENIAVFVDLNIETRTRTVHRQPQEADLLRVGTGWEKDKDRVGTRKLKEGKVVVEEMGSGII